MNATQIVNDYIHAHGINQKRLAQLLSITPQNLSNKLSREHISVKFLESISDALKHNFFADLSDLWKRKHFKVNDVVSASNEKDATFEKMLEKMVEMKINEKLRH